MNTPTRDPWEGEKALHTVEAACNALRFLRQREHGAAETQLKAMRRSREVIAKMKVRPGIAPAAEVIDATRQKLREHPIRPDAEGGVVAP